MQIASISDFATSSVNYFLKSSWKGRTVQVLGALSIFSLFYYLFLKKAPPKGPDTSAKPLSGRAENKEKTPTGPNTPPTMSSSRETRTEKSSKESVASQTTSSSKVQLKAGLSYIQKTQIDPDFKFPQSEFDTWLSFQMENFPQWIVWARSGDQGQEDSCREALNRCTPWFKNHVKEMIPIFEDRRVKQLDLGAFLKDCNEAVLDQKANLLDFCMKLKGYLEKLQSWNTALHKRNEKELMDKVKNVSICPHYEFTHLQTQYFHYLRLHTPDMISRLLETNLDYLEKFGIREMEDVNCLQLTNMHPLIERLRQFVCIFEITRDKEAVRPLIEKEIKQCREMLTISENIWFYANYGQELKENVKNLRELFNRLACNFDDGLYVLHQIEENDVVRQRILLKGYINQFGLRAKWKQLNEEGVVSLAACAKAYQIDTLAQFYKMSAVERRI